MIDVIFSNYDASYNQEYVYHSQVGYPFWLLLLMYTPAVYEVNGKKEKHTGGSIVLFEPFQPISIRSDQKSYLNNEIRFVTDEPVIVESKIPTGQPIVIEHSVNIHMLFQMMTEEFNKRNLMRKDSLEKILLIIFNKLIDVYSAKPPEIRCNNIHDLHNMIHKQPSMSWSVEMMAEKLNISTSHLEKSYKKEFGKSCMEDVFLSRVQMAKKLLRDVSLSTDEIIKACGYRSRSHFYRQFKAVTQVTPGEYRKRKLKE